jgi:hypothetical protein
MMAIIDDAYAKNKAAVNEQYGLVERCKLDHVERGRAFNNLSVRVEEVIDTTKSSLRQIAGDFSDNEAQRDVGPLTQAVSFDDLADKFKTDCAARIKAAAKANAEDEKAKIHDEEKKLETILERQVKKSNDELECELKAAKKAEEAERKVKEEERKGREEERKAKE